MDLPRRIVRAPRQNPKHRHQVFHAVSERLGFRLVDRGGVKQVKRFF